MNGATMNGAIMNGVAAGSATMSSTTTTTASTIMNMRRGVNGTYAASRVATSALDHAVTVALNLYLKRGDMGGGITQICELL